MANFKRSKPKTHKWVTGPGGPKCYCCTDKMQGNSPLRVSVRDKRQPQWYPDDDY